MREIADTLAHLGSEADTQAALEQIAVSACATLGADRVTCYSLDVDTQCVDAVHTTEADPARRRLLADAVGRDVAAMPLWPPNFGGGHLFVVEHVVGDPRIPRRLRRDLGAGAFVGVVLTHASMGPFGSRPLGALYCSYLRPRRFTDEDITGVRGVAGLAALALSNAFLQRLAAQSLAENASLVAEQSALRRVATAVAGGAGVEEVCEAVAAEVASLPEADAALVIRFVAGAGVPVAACGTGAGTAPFVVDGTHAIARVALGGTWVTGDAGALPAGLLPEELRDVTAAPVTVDGHVWGCVVAATGRRHGLRSQAPSRLERLADMVSLGVANADARERLTVAASTDQLTGLANHRAFFERLSADIERAHRYGHGLSLVLMDLDHFKRVNDRHGHLVGDRVLAALAERLRRCVRLGDTIARIGGEEFAWILPETRIGAALATAERARGLVGTVPFPVAGPLTISAGVAELTGSMVLEDLYRTADRALYRAKSEGRDRGRAATDQALSR